MARITVEDCIDKFESRFELVLVASNRARKLHSGENPTVEKDDDKPTVIALREIANESLSIDSLKDKLIQEYQTISPLDEEELSLEHDNSASETNDEIIKDEAEPQDEVTSQDEVQLNEVNKLNEPGISDNDVGILTPKNNDYTDISDDNNPEKQ